MATNNSEIANRNIRFFIDAALLEDDDCRISDAIERDHPVLPSLSGTAPPTPAGMHSVPEIISLYNFPSGYDDPGQTVGILEFAGSIVPADLDRYLKSLNLPTPDVSPIVIDGASTKPDMNSDAQIMMDIEILGSIVPRAHIRVYFAPFTATDFADSLKRATADHVSVMGIGWGRPENAWHDEEINTIYNALEAAAKQRMTVVAAAGDLGVTDGVRDGHRHVDFPGSSPWVLSTGGTTLKSEAAHMISEIVWRSDPESATGGEVSDKFSRPDWQPAVSVPPREDGKFGCGIPDLAGSADPQLGMPIIVHGVSTLVGGTGATVPLWAGLVAVINQALGYNVGHLNPRLYREIGPAGLFRTITSVTTMSLE